jgi:hypothetical protein
MSIQYSICWVATTSMTIYLYVQDSSLHTEGSLGRSEHEISMLGILPGTSQEGHERIAHKMGTLL